MSTLGRVSFADTDSCGAVLEPLASHQCLKQALETLVDVARNGKSDAARVSTANSLLDRGYGKPAVKEEIEHVDLPPVVIQIKAPDDDATV